MRFVKLMWQPDDGGEEPLPVRVNMAHVESYGAHPLGGSAFANHDGRYLETPDEIDRLLAAPEGGRPIDIVAWLLVDNASWIHAMFSDEVAASIPEYLVEAARDPVRHAEWFAGCVEVGIGMAKSLFIRRRHGWVLDYDTSEKAL